MIKPLDNHVVLKVEKQSQEEKQVGGIYLAGAKEEKPNTAEVLAVGPGRVLENGNRISPEVEVGQKVLFDKYAGNEVEFDGQKYLVVRDTDLIAVID